MEALHKKHQVGRFVLWGRSMGAASAVKHCQGRDNTSILGLVLDSCFKSFEQLATEIGRKQTDIPEVLIKIGLFFIRSTLEEKGQFKMEELELEDGVAYLDMPVLFLTSQEDDTVDCSHSQALYNRLRHPSKKLVYIKGLHNESRDHHYLKEVT